MTITTATVTRFPHMALSTMATMLQRLEDWSTGNEWHITLSTQITAPSPWARHFLSKVPDWHLVCTETAPFIVRSDKDHIQRCIITYLPHAIDLQLQYDCIHPKPNAAVKNEIADGTFPPRLHQGSSQSWLFHL
ncbi:hypothetical protein DM01DRAFT_1158046 [Hesseltinella vesiculosa]|uniref:Uncharacterized protein n=1 Tax=Hesseltinella vesiculosa TaxID=101127 RepID=A0A1X2GS99_9FUNG|nr:hypothetical protein DM01DRAFT_1158046 [Hesseltinella vesiculosa]